MKHLVKLQPIGRSITVVEGTTVLDAAREAGVGLLATCGGQASCGSCVIRVIYGMPETGPDSTEKEHLSISELEAGYRLACHTPVQSDMVIDIPAQSLNTPQRLQVEGEEKTVNLNPKVKIVDLDLDHDRIDITKDFYDYLHQEIKEKIPTRSSLPDDFYSKTISLMLQTGGKSRILLHDDHTVSILLPETPVLGLAVDIGTTKIAGYLVDLDSGITLSKQGLINPQVAYGDDIMARITYALANKSGAEILQKSVIEAINQLATKLCDTANKSHENKPPICTYRPHHIAEAIMVGNTAMHHITMGLSLKQLGTAPYTPDIYEEMITPARNLGFCFADQSLVHMLPNIAGFVGADHVSMLLATGIQEAKQNTLYIDIGTNTEITLIMNHRMLCCSTASGPAFEGAHIRDGMRATDGAIEKIRIDGEEIRFHTIGDKKPTGICGSGIIDAIAQMLKSGILDERGIFNESHPLVRKGERGPELVIVQGDKTAHGSDILINRKDISEIQLAKGAIRAGIELLLAETGGGIQHIEKVIVAGAFGSFIDIRSAKIIGLFPDLNTSRFKQVGNAAGMGARHSLLSIHMREEASVIANKLEYIELATHTGFTEAFSKAIMFGPVC